MAKKLPDAAMPLGDKRSSGMGKGVDTGPEHGQAMKLLSATPRKPMPGITRLPPPAP